MASGDAYDVFISYARSDSDVAAELNGWLIAQGVSTFFDRSALHPGLPWVPALEEAIGRARAVAILVGPHGLGNTQQYERELALVRQTGDRTFPVIPVLMPRCEQPPTGFLQLLTWVDLSKGKTIREQPGSLEALRAALRGETVAASAVRASICPYRGLEPFREEDAAFFCGRDAAIRELVARVQEHAFVAVVGPSGSGKSSLVFAGLLPALRKQARTTMWDVVTLRPGKRPLNALAEAFGTVPAKAGEFEFDAWLEKEASFLRAGDVETLARAVDRHLDAAPEKPDRLLIYVDQWEELYAMAPPPEDKARVEQHGADVEKFIALLVATAADPRSRAKVVLTVRADFYNPLTRNPLLAALLPKQQVNIPPMSRDDLREAIVTPAKAAWLSFAPPALVDRILDDVGLEEGRLPLLQFALKETWRQRAGDRLTADAYTEVGGVARAIEKTAEDAYERLTPAQKDAARRLFLRLVTPGEGQADTRARSLLPDDPEQRDIVALFSNPKTRLLVTALQAAGPAGGEVRATVEVAHEALIQRWPTLRDWVRANRENLRARAAILRAQAEWEEHGRDETFLLDPGVQLERGRALLANPGDVAIDDIRDYVVCSIGKDQRRLEAEREAAVADQKRIANAQRQAREAAERTVAEQQRALTHLREAQIMQSRYLADQARQQRTADPAIAVLLALEALPDAAAGKDRPYVPEAELQLDGAWRELRERLALVHDGAVYSAAFSPDGQRIVTASSDKTARVWDAASGKPIGEPLTGHEGMVRSAAFSPDGKRIVTASDDKTARVWDAESLKPIGQPLKGHEYRVRSAAFSPDGKRIVTASWDKTARVWDAASGKPIGEPLKGHKQWLWSAAVCSAAFSPDGQRIVTASSDKTARVWDAESGKPIGRLKGHEGAVHSAAFSPDGQRIVTASRDETARVWDAASGKPIGEPLKGHQDSVLTAAFDPDGQRIVTASWDGTARVWDAASGKPIGEPLKGHDGSVYSALKDHDSAVYSDLMAHEGAVYSAPGHEGVVYSALTESAVDSAILERAAHRAAVAALLARAVHSAAVAHKGAVYSALKDHEGAVSALKDHDDAVYGAAFSPDGTRIVTASSDKTARVWDAAGGKPIGEPLTGHDNDVNSAAFSPDGTRIVTASSDKTARVRDAAGGKPIGEPLTGHDNDVNSAAFSPDGTRIVTASSDKTARVRDAAGGKPIGEPLTGHDNDVNSAAFSPDGQRIVTASSDGTARVWDAASLKPISEPLKGHDDNVNSAAFSPDGTRIVTASRDKTARVWDAASGKPIGEPLKGHDNVVNSAAFSPDGTRIVTASSDKTARVWDAASGKPIGEPLKGHEYFVNGAAFSPDGQRIVTASWDGTARVWDAASGKPIREPLTGHNGKVNSAAFSPDGQRIVTASRDKTARVWDILPDTQALVSAAKAGVPRCLTPAQRKAFFLPPEPPEWCIEMAKQPYDTPAWKQWLADKRAGKTPPLPAER